MADEAITPAAPEATAETEATAQPSAGTKNTDTPAEPMIPKSRFDEVNNRLKAIEQESAKTAKAAQEAETKRLAEEGKYKELFEKQQAELEAERKVARESATKLLQRQAADEVKLPAALAGRLQGETLEEMIADAKSILAALPRPAAPNINAESGAGGMPGPGQLSEAEKQRIADKYRVDPRYI